MSVYVHNGWRDIGKGVCVRVCVPAQTACEDVLVSVYPTPPSVSDEQNTYVI